MEIDIHIHSNLLFLLDELDYGEAQLYRKQLQAAYADHQASVANYRALAETIRSKAGATKDWPVK